MKGENAHLDKAKRSLLQPSLPARVAGIMRNLATLAACVVLLPSLAPAQSALSDLVHPSVPFPATGRPQPDIDRPGPWDRDVRVYRLHPDGKVEPFVAFERAGVSFAAINCRHRTSAKTVP